MRAHQPLLSVLLLLSCQAELNLQKTPPPGQPMPTPEPPPPPPDTTPVALLVHAAPDAPLLDVYLDDKLAVAGLAYRGTTGNVKLPAGSHELAVRAAGTPGSGLPLYQAAVDLRAADRRLLLLQGRFGDGSFQLGSLSYGGAADAGGVRLRLVDAAPSAPTLDLSQDGHSLLSGIAVGFGKGSEYAAFPGDLLGATQLGVRAARLHTDLLLLSTPFARRGAVLSAVALGEVDPLAPADRALSAVVIDEATGQAFSDAHVRINNQQRGSFLLFHAGARLPDLELRDRNSSAVLIADLKPGAVSPVIELPGGLQQLGLYSRGAAKATAQADLKLLPALSFTLLVHGEAPPAPDAARVTALLRGAGAGFRVFHGIVDAGPLDVTLDNGVPVARSLGYGAASQPRDGNLPMTTLHLRLSGAGRDLLTIKVPLKLSQAAAGRPATIVLYGTLAALSAQLLLESGPTPQALKLL